MNVYGDYSTVKDTRQVYLNSTSATEDALLLSMIHQASTDIDRVSHRRFHPVVETKKYNTPAMYSTDLNLDAELFELTSVTNGDNSLLSNADLLLVPYNTPTHRAIRLLPTIATWKNAPSGLPYSAITVVGTWTSIADYTAGWMSLSTLLAALNDTDVTFAATAGVYSAGMLLRVDDEFMYVSAVALPVLPATTDTVTVVRGVNGTVAATHLITAPVSIWNCGRDISMLAASAAVAYYYLRSNPTGNSYTIDGVTFETPKDVAEFIRRRLIDLNLIRVGIG